MRVWDVSPGYLRPKNLLGEHAEIHALLAVIERRSTSPYARHPETLRWVDFVGGLRARHDAVAAELALRGYRHRSPVAAWDRSTPFPSAFLDTPAAQFILLRAKTPPGDGGRIALPRSGAELAAHHLASARARGVVLDPTESLDAVAKACARLLDTPPSAEGVTAALDWLETLGGVAEEAHGTPAQRLGWLALRAAAVPALAAQTALCDLAAWGEGISECGLAGIPGRAPR